MAPLQRTALPKPLKGEYALERHARKADGRAEEQRTMTRAKIRDGRKCRWPVCRLKLQIEACHRMHRGMGGNPDGSRTTRGTLITFCTRHHQLWDLSQIDVRPQEERIGFDGCADFFVRSESGEWQIFASERLIGVSVTRGTA